MPKGDEDDGSLYNSVELVLDGVYALGVAVSLFMLADSLSDGALSRSASLWLYRLQGDLTSWIVNRRTLRKEVSLMLWEAIQIVDNVKENESGA